MFVDFVDGVIKFMRTKSEEIQLFVIKPNSNIGKNRNMNRYVALENINYDSLQLGKRKPTPQTSRSEPMSPDSLMCQSCRAICVYPSSGSSHSLAEEATLSIPSHLAIPLLQEAIKASQASAVVSILANWPLHVLSFKEMLGENQKNVFEEEMSFDLVVFKGITSRSSKCCMRLLDFRGFTLNMTFTKLMIQMWPILSLKKSRRTVKGLTNHILKVAGLKKEIKLAKDIIPKLIADLLNSIMAKHPSFFINIPKGKRLCVKLDRLEFSTQNTFFMDYLITNCLRSITPVYIMASSIVIRSELNIGDEILDSLAPFIVFRGQNAQELDGIWLENLEDNVFFLTSPDLHDFSHIRGLGVPNCNIMLLEGRTRRRTSVRCQFTKVLQSFSNLIRLDVSQNCFAGCLPEILDSLVLPLEYLCLRECDLLDRDMDYLASSRHAASIKQLNVSKICGLFPEDSFAVNPSTLVRCLKFFKRLQVLHMQQNQITDQRVAEVCQTILHHWRHLKSLNITDNMFSVDNALRIVEACVQMKSMQLVRVPYLHNLFDAINLMENGRQEFARRVATISERFGRNDVSVEVDSVVSYAAFLNI